MKEYLLLFRNVSGNDAYITTAQDMAQDMPAWQHWIGSIAMQGKLVATQPMEYHGQVVSGFGKQIGPQKDASDMLVAGFLICKADSFEEVSAWSTTCPILKYPLGSVEIRPLVPYPIN